MTFEQFLISKFPLYEGKDLRDFHLSIQQAIDLVNEYLNLSK